jgi:hypothetical protein
MDFGAFFYGLILFCAIAAALLCEIYARKAHIPPVPSMPWMRRIMVESLKKHLNASGKLKIAELGSGWSGLLFDLGKIYGDSEIYGFEMAPLPFYFTRLRLLSSGHKNIQIHKTDFFLQDLSRFDAVLAYLSPWHMDQLKDKLERELRPGAIVISNAFPIRDWTPAEIHTVSKFTVKTPVYIYRKL